MNKIRNINLINLENSNFLIINSFLRGDKDFIALSHFIILNSTLEYILATKWCDWSFFLE